MVKKKAIKKMKKSSAVKKNSLKMKNKKMVKKAIKNKKKKVLAIPKGYHSIIPYIVMHHASKAIEFYKKAFDAKESFRMEQPNGKIAHAELKVGDSKIMLGDECSEKNTRSPETYGESAITIHFYTKNVDKVVDKAISLGAKIIRPIENMFYGDRCAMIEDPYGHKWHVSTHIEDVTPAKAKKRAAEGSVANRPLQSAII